MAEKVKLSANEVDEILKEDDEKLLTLKRNQF